MFGGGPRTLFWAAKKAQKWRKKNLSFMKGRSCQKRFKFITLAFHA